MVRFAREGPGNATVDELEVSEEEPEGIRNFSVR